MWSLLLLVLSIDKLAFRGGHIAYHVKHDDPALPICVFAQGGIQSLSIDQLDVVYERIENPRCSMVFFDYCSMGGYSDCTAASTIEEIADESNVVSAHLGRSGRDVHIVLYSSSTLYLPHIRHVQGVLVYAPMLFTFDVAKSRTACLAQQAQFALQLPADLQRAFALWVCAYPCESASGSPTCLGEVIRALLRNFDTPAKLTRFGLSVTNSYIIKEFISREVDHSKTNLEVLSSIAVNASIMIAGSDHDRLTISTNVKRLYDLVVVTPPHQKRYEVVSLLSHVSPLIDGQDFHDGVIRRFVDTMR